MASTAPISEFLSAIAVRGRSIIGLNRGNSTEIAGADIIELCHMLLSSRGDASGIALANEILTRYAELDDEGKLVFFQQLYSVLAADSGESRKTAEAYLAEASIENLAKLHSATEPRRRRLIIRLNQAPNATLQLIRMRSDLLRLLKRHEELQEVDKDFAKLFASWFNGGFLQLQRLDWSSPASVLENIMRYEAVHGMADWEDLRARLDPPDRQIYGFFHPRLGSEPLIFIEVALMDDTPTNIQDILSVRRKRLNPSQATTAVFYSISNCQHGLRGIPLGSFLIKRVVEDLRSEYPQLTKFVTLSPVPGFSSWIKGWLGEPSGEMSPEVMEHLSESLVSLPVSHWNRDKTAKEEMRNLVAAAAGHYLVHVKNGDGLPRDAVARFHLGNGAQLERISWPADTSPQGMAKSFGVMVNYLYNLDELERNHEKLASSGKIAASSRVMRDIGKASFFAKRARAGVSEVS